MDGDGAPSFPTAEDRYLGDGSQALTDLPVACWAANFVAMTASDDVVPEAVEVLQQASVAKLTTATVLVRCNYGRWIADCPWCPSAQVASWTDQRFICADRDCPSNQPGRDPVAARLIWPDSDAVQQIEEQLIVRPQAARNWEPSETVADLVAENDVHAAEIEAGGVMVP